MPNPLVSICVPTYNRAVSLRESLKSICGQDYSPIEILISDNCSNDETESMCRDLAAQDRRIRYVRQPRNIGLYGNHNFCIDESRGEFICLFHDDDLHHPEQVNASVAHLLSHPDVGIVCSNWELIDTDGERVGVRDHDVPEVMSGLEYISRTMRLGQSFIGCPGAMIRRSALEKVRFREDGPIGFGDFVVWFHIAERASVGHIPKRLWQYRLHKGSYSRRSIESLTHDFHFNLNCYCDEHLMRWPDHVALVSRWRKDIDRYLFWALMYEVGLHFRKQKTSESKRASKRSVYEIYDYRLSPEALQSVLGHLGRFCHRPAQKGALFMLKVLLRLRLVTPLAWMVGYSGTLRRVLGFK